MDAENLKKLILKAKGGDSGAFEEVYSTYYTPLFRYIYSRVKSKEEAEDMTQNVFIKIWNAVPTWNASHTSPLSFFFTVARNTMIDYFRKSSHKEIVSDEVIRKFADTVGSHMDTESQETKDSLLLAISKLTDEQREVITLFYTQDLTYEEISTITGKRQDAIRQIHSRAMKKLRDLYKHNI